MSRFSLTYCVLRSGRFVTVALMFAVLLLGGLLPTSVPFSGLAMAQGVELPQRTWADSTSKFEIEASLVAFKDGKVSLKKSDGRIVVLPLERLSQVDQAVAQAMSQLLTSQDDNPFAGGTPTNQPDTNVDRAAPVAADESKLVTTDWSSARSVALTTTRREWSFPIEAASTAPSDNGGRPIPLPPTGDFFEKPTNSNKRWPIQTSSFSSRE